MDELEIDFNLSENNRFNYKKFYTHGIVNPDINKEARRLSNEIKHSINN